jgi:hypothetical protein
VISTAGPNTVGADDRSGDDMTELRWVTYLAPSICGGLAGAA